MRETGTVKAISGGTMEIRMEAARPEMCKGCRACEVFGQGKETVLRVPAVPGLAVGDAVAVEVPEAGPWTGIVFVLGLPITLMVAGLVLGGRWPWWVDHLGGDPDIAGAALGVPLGVLAFLVARVIERRHQRRLTVTPLAP